MLMGYLGRFLLLTGAAVILASIVLKSVAWVIGGLLFVVALFMVAIAYALRLPP